MRFMKTMAVLALLAMSYCAMAQDSAAKRTDKKAPQKTDAKTSASKAVVTSNSVSPIVDAMDTTAEPCTDFYQYACGGWLKKNPLPNDRPRYARFTELYENNSKVLKAILDGVSANDPKRNAVDQKIGDYFVSCMDETAVNSLGVKAIEKELRKVDELKSKDGLTSLIIFLHRATVPVFFSYYSKPDLKNASKVIANVDQGGISLPNRDYYFNDDQRSKDIREKYVEHVGKMLEISGWPKDKAAEGAKAVMAIETKLAGGSLTPVEQRDPKIQYHWKTMAEMEKEAPVVDWARYVPGVGTPQVDGLNLAVPKFTTAMDELLKSTSLDDIKTYLRWHVLHDAAPLLSSDFVNENFNFFGKSLAGTKELLPRWKRCVQFTDNNLGEALGIAYVEKTYGPEGKRRMQELVANLESALKEDIESLDWMSAGTKKQALIKLVAIQNKIGHPEKWRDYSSVNVVRGDAMGNAARASEFEFQHTLNKIGKPVDKTEWGMTPPTVNAYYNPQENNINFPAGILQPPFFYRNLDDAVNYGGIGVVIGHELTHGFDDEGSQFDAEGNLRDWWTTDDKAKFEERTGCVDKQYSGYVATKNEKGEDVHLNGKLTLGENTADNGGMRISWMALQKAMAGKPPAKIDGFTSEQRFFLAFAQVWCEQATTRVLELQARSNPHSNGRYRAIGTVSNMPEFQQAFSCKAGQPMVQEKRCRVW